VFGRRLAGHSHHTEHPLRRRVLLTILGAAVLAALFLLIAPRNANGNFVYWSNQDPSTTIGRAKINGTGVNDAFITGLSGPQGVATDSRYIYWADSGAGQIGRANLDGSGVNESFITLPAGRAPLGVAVTPASGIYWGSNGVAGARVGHANIDGTNPDDDFVPLPGGASVCGVAADQSFVYWLDDSNNQIGRATLSGGDPLPNFALLPSSGCGVAVDSSYLYWGAGNSVGRLPVGGGDADSNFIPFPGGGSGATGVAVQPQYIFWAANGGTPANNHIGRANLNGSSPNPTLISGLGDPQLISAAPSNKITVNSVKKKKKKGTATIDAKVPGPGQVTLNQTSAPPDVNAVEAGVKQVGLTITQASSFKLAVKPTGKTAKKLNKQVKKQLRKKRKAKAKASVTVFIHFVPAGVAGVPNTEQRKITFVKQRSKKK
jgi:hypothetical protein